VAALDLGEKLIGVAITDAQGGFVVHRSTIARRSGAHDRAALAAVLDAHPGATVVVGLPLLPDGTEGAQVIRTRRWAAALLAHRPERIVFRDERLTTAAARAAGAAPAALDAWSAEVLLRDFLAAPGR